MTFSEDLDVAIAKATETRTAVEAVAKDSLTGADEIHITAFHVSPQGNVQMTIVLLASGVPSSISDKLAQLSKLTRGTR